MKGTHVVLTRDDRCKTPRIVSTFFHADLVPPFLKFTSRRRRVTWRIDGSVLIVNRHPSAFGESSTLFRPSNSAALRLCASRAGSVQKPNFHATWPK